MSNAVRMSDAACKSYAEASLYVHVPFCAGLCDYCDFYSLDVYKYAQLRELFVEIQGVTEQQ